MTIIPKSGIVALLPNSCEADLLTWIINHRDIRDRANAQWHALPPHFRLESSLKHCNQTPVIRDFILNARLNHLHVLFLLRMAVTRSRPETDPELVSTAAEILTLVVEALMQKDYLVNSGTSLVWKVSPNGSFGV